MTRSTSNTGNRIPSAAEVLDDAHAAVNSRGEELGSVNAVYQPVADLWTAYLASLDEGTPLSVRDVMRMMTLFKVARDMAAPDHVDHAVDIAGYASLLPQSSQS